MFLFLSIQIKNALYIRRYYTHYERVEYSMNPSPRTNVYIIASYKDGVEGFSQKILYNSKKTSKLYSSHRKHNAIYILHSELQVQCTGIYFCILHEIWLLCVCTLYNTV